MDTYFVYFFSINQKQTTYNNLPLKVMFLRTDPGSTIHAEKHVSGTVPKRDSIHSFSLTYFSQ